MNIFLEKLIKKRENIFPNIDFIKQAKLMDNLNIDNEYKLKNYLHACQYLPILKIAYPHKYQNNAQQTYDINKWFLAISQIYSMHSQGIPLSEGTLNVISSWESKEQKDFKNWLSFYQQEGNLKYKKAQVYPASFLKADVPTLPVGPNLNKNFTQSPELDAKIILAKKIQGIVGRLNAAERIATDPEIRDILSKRLDINLDAWLKLLHEVKRTIQTAPIKNVMSSLLEDLIVKQANILKYNGKHKAAQELIFIAQEVVPPAQEPIPQENVEDSKSPIDDFIKAINGNDDDDKDTNEIIDPEPDDLANIRVLAQDAVLNQQVQPQQPMQQKQDNIVVEEPDNNDKIDEAFDEALKNVTVQDVINALERLANLLRNREIPRILSKVDLMMNQLNISSFFPALAEASNKSLESNQYALTRIDDILSKLRGVVSSPNEINLSDLQGNQSQSSIQNNLEKEQAIEQALKEKRKKNQRAQELSAPEKNNQQQQLPQETVSPALTQAQPQIQNNQAI